MKRFALPLLVVLLLGATGFGVVQYQDAQRLRAELAGLGKDRDDLRKKLWDAQKQKAAAAKSARDEAAAPGAVEGRGDEGRNLAKPTAAAPLERMRAEGGPFNAMMNSPEVQQLMAIQQKANLDSRYAGLFKRLNLSPADLEKFKNLLVEKQATVMDAIAAAREQGMLGRDNRDEIRTLVQNAQAEVDDSIRTTLGDGVYSQYKSYEATLPQRSVVDQLGQRLSYSTTPLSDTQADQLVQIMASTAPAGTGSSGGGGARGAMAMGLVSAFPGGAQVAAMMGGGAKITDAAVTQAQGVLAPPQVAALQSLQQEQQASAKLMEQMRANRQGGGATRVNAAPSTPAAGR